MKNEMLQLFDRSRGKVNEGWNLIQESGETEH